MVKIKTLGEKIKTLRERKEMENFKIINNLWSIYYKYIPPRKHIAVIKPSPLINTLGDCSGILGDKVYNKLSKCNKKLLRINRTGATAATEIRLSINNEEKIMIDPLILKNNTKMQDRGTNLVYKFWKLPDTIMNYIIGKQFCSKPDKKNPCLELTDFLEKTIHYFKKKDLFDVENVSINNYGLNTIAGIKGRNCLNSILTFSNNNINNFYIDPLDKTNKNQYCYDFFTTDNSLIYYNDEIKKVSSSAEENSNTDLVRINETYETDIDLHGLDLKLINEKWKQTSDTQIIPVKIVTYLKDVCKKNKNIIFFIPYIIKNDDPSKQENIGEFVYHQSLLKKKEDGIELPNTILIHVSMPILSKALIEELKIEVKSNELALTKLKDGKVDIVGIKPDHTRKIYKKTLIDIKERALYLKNLADRYENIKFSLMGELVVDTDTNTLKTSTKISSNIVSKILAKKELFKGNITEEDNSEDDLDEISYEQPVIYNDKLTYNIADEGATLKIVKININNRERKFLLGKGKVNKTYNLYDFETDSKRHYLVGEFIRQSKNKCEIRIKPDKI